MEQRRGGCGLDDVRRQERVTLSKAALLIGIDDYPTAPLISCVADVQAMAALLSRIEVGSPN
ncbi:MAG: caspase family protein, partial [Actinobacteria bacterium]|nr:caspase family protein [Actinomycetota bacterium]